MNIRRIRLDANRAGKQFERSSLCGRRCSSDGRGGESTGGQGGKVAVVGKRGDGWAEGGCEG